MVVREVWGTSEKFPKVQWVKIEELHKLYDTGKEEKKK